MTNDKLEKLLAQRKAIDERIKLEQNRENERKRKDDTRRKILAGAAVLDEAEHNAPYKAALYPLLERFLTREQDRALFGFEPLPESNIQAEVNSESKLEDGKNQPPAS